MDLKQQTCEPCHSVAEPLAPEQCAEYLKELREWQMLSLDGIDRLVKTYPFDSYQGGLDFALAVGRIAEEVGHHPVMEIHWGKVCVSWWTHNIRGLHLNDFIMAARTDDLYSRASNS